mgnify:CR=1 FL=1
MFRPWRQTTEEVTAVDVRDLSRGGVLPVRTRSIEFGYTSGGEYVRQSVEVTWSPCHFGGERAWFGCPICGRRVAILYCIDGLACRTCHGLYFECQRTRGKSSARIKLQRLRERLGGSANLSEPFPARPYRMRHKTYERLRLQAKELERRYVTGVLVVLQRLRAEQAAGARWPQR